MKAQLTLEFILSFLMIVIIVGLLSNALNEYYKSVKIERDILEKRMTLENSAFSEGIMQAGLSNYEQTNSKSKNPGQENIYHEKGINTRGVYRNKIYTGDDESDCLDVGGQSIICTTN